MIAPIRIYERSERFIVRSSSEARSSSAAVAELLRRVGHIVRPLCLEIAAGPIDPLTSRVERPEHWVRLQERVLPPGVEPSLGAKDVRTQLVDSLGPVTVARALDQASGALDRIDFFAVLAAVDVDAAPSIEVNGVVGGAPLVRRGPRLWVAGPLGAAGAARIPPLRVTIESEPAGPVLTIETTWSPWQTEGRPELGRLRALVKPA